MSNNVCNTCFSRRIEWFRAPNVNICSRVVRRTIGIALSIILIATVIGIAVLVLAARQWKKNTPSRSVVADTAKTVFPPPTPLPRAAGAATTAAAANGAPLPVQPIADEFGKNLEAVDRQEVLALQSFVVQREDKTSSGKPPYQLKLADLEEGQMPKYKKSIGDTTYYFSDRLELMENSGIPHDGCLVLVKIGADKVYPRLFNHSNSNATWRAIPAAKKTPSGGMREYCKGRSEIEVELPISLTCALNTLPKHEISKPANELTGLVETGSKIGGYTKAGTSEFVKYFHDEIHEIAVHDELLKTADHTAMHENSSHANAAESLRADASQNVTKNDSDENDGPDLSRIIYSAKYNVAEYGDITAEVYDSKNGKFRYLIHIDCKDRIWVASIEVKHSQINKWGIQNDKPLLGNDGLPPLLELSEAISNDDYPKTDKGRKPYENCNSKYLSNWNRLRRMKIIQSIYLAKGKQIPDPI